MHIVLDSGNSRRASGVGVYTSSLLDGLRMFGGDSIHAEESTIGEGRASLRPLWRLLYLWRLRGAVSGGFGGADVVHFTNVFVPRKAAACAYVATIHDLEPMLFPKVTTRRYVAYYRWAVQRTLRVADIVLTDTNAVRQQILERYPFAAERVKVAGIGLSPRFMSVIDQIPTGSPRQPPVLLFIGTLTRKKNVAWLTRTVHHGMRRGALPPMRLVLAGQAGHGHEEVQRAVADAGGAVTLVERPDLVTLASLYRAATALVLPSHTEGFGIPLIEAAYCGVPIIASRIPTSLEVAAGCGEFFELGNEEEFYHAVRTVVDEGPSPSRRAAMDACVQRYSWERLIPQYLAAYAEALAQRGGSRA